MSARSYEGNDKLLWWYSNPDIDPKLWIIEGTEGKTLGRRENEKVHFRLISYQSRILPYGGPSSLRHSKMGFEQLLTACALLYVCSADQQFRIVNSSLDPSRVTWWRTRWAPSPIQLSSNNAGQDSVTATFYFCPSTSLTNGVVEITLPAGAFTVTASATQAVSGSTVSKAGQTLVGGQDTTVVLTGLKNPAQEGPVGPFALRTRASPSGPQVDVNLAFAVLYIRPAVSTISSATVAVVGAASTVVNRPNNVLSFKLTIAAALWRFDSFAVQFDSRWAVAVGAGCSSADYSLKWNNFNGTSAANPHALQCFVSSKTASTNYQVVYVYGLAVDGIDTTVDDNKYVDLRITSVTSPNAVYSGHSYRWQVTTYRFGTSTMLEQAVITLGPTVVPDVPSAVTWGSTWAAADLHTGLSYFMDLTVTLASAVPLDAGSYVEVQVTETIAALTGAENWLPSGAANCYVATFHSRDVVCTVTSTNTITLSSLPALPAGTTLKVRNLVTIVTAAGQSARVASVKSYLNAGTLIDSGPAAGTGTVAIASAGVVAATFQVFPVVVNSFVAISLAGGTGANTLSLQFVIIGNPHTAIPATADTTVTISGPFMNTLDDFAFGLPSTVAYAFTDSATATAIAMPATAMTANQPVINPASKGAHGTITFTGAIGAFTLGTHLSVFQGAAATTPYITLPRVSTNAATAYECRLSIAIKGGVTQRGAARFIVTPQPFTVSTFTAACLDRIDGVPVVFQLQPAVLKVAASSSDMRYFVEFEFASVNGDFASGLTPPTFSASSNTDNALNSAVQYPIDKSGVSGNPAAYLYKQGTTAYLAVTDIGEIAVTATGVKLVFPIGGMANGAVVAPVIRSYYVYAEATDPRYKHITHSVTAGSQTFPTEAANAWTTAPALVSGGTVTTWEANAAGTVFNLADSDSPTVANEASTYDQYYYVVLPTGFKWASASAVKRVVGTGSALFTSVWRFSAPTWGFKFPGVLFSSGSSGTAVNLPQAADSTNGVLAISGFQPPPGSGAASLKLVLGASGNAACKAISAASLTVASGQITNISVSNQTIKVKGPDGVNVSHTVSFTLAHGVPASGKVEMVVSSEWTMTTCTECAVAGLVGTCAVSGNTVTVTVSSESAAAGLSVAVSGLLAPASARSYAFVTSLSTKTAGGTDIDTAGSAQLQALLVTTTAGSDIGKTTWAATQTSVPNVAGATGVDLYLKFSLMHALYRTCGTITLSSPYPFRATGSDCKNSVFFSLGYSSCSWSGSSLTLTLSRDYSAGSSLELYIDSAVDNPSTTASSSTGFAVSTMWFTQQVDVDQPNSSLSFAAVAPPTSVISATATLSLDFSPKNAGEPATYTFVFKDSAAYASTDQFWIVFPRQFDYFLGDVWQWFSSEPNTYYIDCQSVQLGTVWCTIDHGIVVVSGSNDVAGNVEIAISVSGVVNPAPSQTDSFQIYHVGAGGEYKSFTQAFGAVTPTAFPGDISVRSLAQTDRRVYKASDYSWRLYLVDVLGTDSQLKVLFPREFDLKKFDKKDSFSCASMYQDVSATSVDRTPKSWNAGSSCAIAGNWVTLPAPAAPYTFTSTSIITWTLQSVTNPQSALTRSQLDLNRDFDLTDKTLWPLDPLWSSQFSFFVYQSSQAKFSLKSYQNTNAAYAGFTRPHRQLIVNGYNPTGKTGRITVYAGTQTKDLLIATESMQMPVAAKALILTPSTNGQTPDGGKLRYSSVIDNWTLSQGFFSAQFRVSAACTLPKGLFYIDWSLLETRQSGLSDDHYDPPASTLLEVVSTPQQSLISVSAIPTVQTGATSVPIKLSVAYPPHTEVTVAMSLGTAPAGIVINPAAVTFQPDMNEKYFEIQVADNYDLASLPATQRLMFTLSGTDKTAFSIVDSVVITISQGSAQNVPSTIASFGLSQATRTTVTFSPSVGRFGVVYYQLAARGSTVASFSSLKASVASLVGQNAANSSPRSSEGARTEFDPEDGESWVSFQRRLYRTHLSTLWVGAVAVYSSSAPVAVDWLWAGTNYQLSGYLDDLSPTAERPVLTEYFSTQATADYQPVEFTYKGSVAGSFLSILSTEYAGLIGVNPLRLADGKVTTAGKRKLQQSVDFSVFSYSLLPNRFSESPAPAEQAKLSTAQVETLTAELKALGIDNGWGGFSMPSPAAKIPPTWQSRPSIVASTSSSLTVAMRASIAGESCCVALTSWAAAPTSEQVMLGLDPSNQAAPGACSATDLAGNLLTIENLQAATYYVYCSATDNYPLWPTQMTFTAANPIEPLTAATAAESTDSPSSAALSVLVSSFAVIL